MPDPVRVLVCGGRDFSGVRLAFDTLDRLHHETPIATLIEGGATGADEIARTWARARGVVVRTFHAEWQRYGKAAGPIRNLRMIEVGKPDLVVAFSGGKGTADMVRQAESAGIKVIKVAMYGAIGDR